MGDNNPNFSDVGGGSTGAGSTGAGSTGAGSTAAGASGKGASPDFSDVQGGSSTTANAGTQSYTVKKGDTLSKIAKQFYGSASKWHKIHEANRDAIPNPDLIHPGLQLTIPPA